MVGGFDRYYQIARCMRDEDLRADRQFEFTQLDMECSFATQDDVMAYVSEAVLDAAEAASGERPPAMARMTWAEALDKYGTDKPDLRFDMQLIDLSEEFAITEVRAFSSPVVKALLVHGVANDFTRSRLDSLTDIAKKAGAAGLAWFKVGYAQAGAGGGKLALEGPLERFLSKEEEATFLTKTKAEYGDLILAVSDEYKTACQVLGLLRTTLGSPPVSQGPHRYVWVVDFPMFESIDAAGHPVAAHHPFTMPYTDDLPLLESDPLKVRSQAYDLVLNGWELGSGSVRIHRSDIQARVFAALGISAADAEARFGFLLGAFRFGAPPHAGFAFGIDRLVAILAGEENIREVIAYPKTQSGVDPLTGAPTPVTAATLAELGVRVVVPPPTAPSAAAPPTDPPKAE
jgi:aspartyl-tRNA synthetase